MNIDRYETLDSIFFEGVRILILSTALNILAKMMDVSYQGQEGDNCLSHPLLRFYILHLKINNNN